MPKRRIKGEGSLIKLGPNKFKLTLTICTEDGKQKRTSKTGTKEAIKQWKESIVSDHRKLPKLSYLMDTYFQMWKIGKKPVTVYSVSKYSNVILKNGDPYVNEVDEDYILQLHLAHKDSPSYHNALMSFLGRTLSFASKKGLISYVPNVVKIPLQPKQRMFQIIPYEMIKPIILKAESYFLDNTRLTKPTINSVIIVLTLGLMCGLRISEMIALKWRNVDLKNSRLTICENYSGLVLSTPKTTKSTRTIYVPSFVMEILTKYGSPNESNNEVIFRKSQSKTIAHKISSAIKRFLTDMGYPNITNHKLRHIFISNMLVKGIYNVDVAHYVGHRNVTTTLNSYAHSDNNFSLFDLCESKN